MQNKRLNSITFLLLVVAVVTACKKESENPGVTDIVFSYRSASGNDSVATTLTAGVPVKITVKTDPKTNGICVVWPGTWADKLADYGKAGVNGITMLPNPEQDGYAIMYTRYNDAGTYTLDVIVTRDGHNGNYKQTHVSESVTVK